MSALVNEIIRTIELILIEEGQHDLKFKLGEIIKYSPTEVAEILRKHEDEIIDVLDASGRCDWY